MKRATARAARAMVTATKRAIATNYDNTGNGYGEEDDVCSMSMATMTGMARRLRPLAL
jgi:hypothetical protein